MSGDRNETLAEQISAGTQGVADYELRRLACVVAAEVPGVAEEPRLSQVQIQYGVEGLTVGCAVSARHGVALHELGLALQVAIATVLRRAGRRVQAVNVTILDIE